MRRGYESDVMLTKKGEIFAIGTGSDACTEHECGSARMQELLCTTQAGTSDGAVESRLRALVKEGKEPSMDFPPLVERKAITRNLQDIRLVDTTVSTPDGKVPVLVVGFCPPRHCWRQNEPLTDAMIDARLLENAHEALDAFRGSISAKSIHPWAGAWDEQGFAFVAIGEKNICKLRVFGEKLKAGGGLFAGTFLKGSLSGVIIALNEHLRPEHRTEIDKAQKEWEDKRLLKAGSRADELYAASATANDALFLSIWPVWYDKDAREIAYAVNPMRDTGLDYYGPYRFEDLMGWIKAPANNKPKIQAYRKNREAA